MPKSMVQRIGKSALPQGTQIQKDAVTAMSKSSTVFISQLAAALGSPHFRLSMKHTANLLSAQSHTSASGKKTIQPHDVMAALHDLELEFMIPRLEAELVKFKDKEAHKRNEYKKARESKSGDKQKESGCAAGEMTAERQLAEESGIVTTAPPTEHAIREKPNLQDIDREKNAKRARGSAGLPVTTGTEEEEEEEEDVDTEEGPVDDQGHEGDVGDDVDDEEDGDETQEEMEGRVGTEDDGDGIDDETEEQDSD